MRRWLILAAWLPVMAAAGWWLFADTVRYHRPSVADHRTIRLAHWGSYQEFQMWQEIIAAFNKVEPDIRVKQEFVVGVSYETKIQQQLVAGNAPDVILFQDEPFPNFAPKGFLDLSRLLARDGIDLRGDYFDTAVDSFVLNGAVRGMPLWGGNVLIYCNPDCFERASRVHGRPIPIPDDDWTLADFVRVAQDLTIDEDGDGRVDQFGFAMPGNWFYLLVLLWPHGMEVLDDTRTQWLMQGPEAEAAWQFVQDLRFRWHVSPLPVEQGEMSGDTAFFTGRVAMHISGPWMQPFLKATTMGNDYRVVHAPRGPAGRATRVTWDCLSIYEQIPPQRQESAWAFVKFACGPVGQRIVARHQRSVPALRSAADVFIAGDDGTGSRKFIEAMAYAKLQPISPYWNEMDRTVNLYLAGLLNEYGRRQTPAEFLAALANDRVIRGRFGGGR